MADREETFGFLLKETAVDAPMYDMGTMDNQPGVALAPTYDLGTSQQPSEHAYTMALGSAPRAATQAPQPPTRSRAREAGGEAGGDYLVPVAGVGNPMYQGLYAVPGGDAFSTGTRPLFPGSLPRASHTASAGIPARQPGPTRLAKVFGVALACALVLAIVGIALAVGGSGSDGDSSAQQSKVQTLSNSVDNHASDITGLKHQVDALLTRVDSLEAANEVLRDRNAVLEAGASLLNTTLLHTIVNLSTSVQLLTAASSAQGDTLGALAAAAGQLVSVNSAQNTTLGELTSASDAQDGGLRKHDTAISMLTTVNAIQNTSIAELAGAYLAHNTTLNEHAVFLSQLSSASALLNTSISLLGNTCFAQSNGSLIIQPKDGQQVLVDGFDLRQLVEDVSTLNASLEALRHRLLGNGSKDSPTVSCRVLRQDFPESQSGYYFIRPAPSTPIFQVWCDMLADGGGWTLVGDSMQVDALDSLHGYTNNVSSARQRLIIEAHPSHVWRVSAKLNAEAGQRLFLRDSQPAHVVENTSPCAVFHLWNSLGAVSCKSSFDGEWTEVLPKSTSCSPCGIGQHICGTASCNGWLLLHQSYIYDCDPLRPHPCRGALSNAIAMPFLWLR